MSLEDVLQSYQPIENEDQDGFGLLKGTYKCIVSKLASAETKEKKPCYKLELAITEVLEGNGSVGRKFFRTYMKDMDNSVKRLLDDGFTMGISFPRKNVEEFEGSFFAAIDAPAMVRAWSYTKEKRKDGTPIPKDEQKPEQYFKIINAQKVKVKAKKTDEVPF